MNLFVSNKYFNDNLLHHFITTGRDVGAVRIGWEKYQKTVLGYGINLSLTGVKHDITSFVVGFVQGNICKRSYTHIFFTADNKLQIDITLMRFKSSFVIVF